MADTFRIATFNASLTRKGPGLLLRDLAAGNDDQIKAVATIIQTVRPDVLLINEIDHDYEGLALQQFLKTLAQGEQGIVYPFTFAPPQNTGVQSGLDLDGNGRVGDPGDAYGFGNFRGQYAMALLSRFPIDAENAADFSKYLWREFPNADMPTYPDGTPFPSAEAQSVMRLSSKGHWDVPVSLPDGRMLRVLASHPTPPVFDGPEDRNGKRNKDEVLFWSRYLEGAIANTKPPSRDFVILGDLNADPSNGDGAHGAIQGLIAGPFVTDPQPRSDGAQVAAQSQGGANDSYVGDVSTTTADWRDAPGPGNLRVDYVLPARTFKVKASGVFWPTPNTPEFRLIGSSGRVSSDHRLVWVDLE